MLDVLHMLCAVRMCGVTRNRDTYNVAAIQPLLDRLMTVISRSSIHQHSYGIGTDTPAAVAPVGRSRPPR